MLAKSGKAFCATAVSSQNLTAVIYPCEMTSEASSLQAKHHLPVILILQQGKELPAPRRALFLEVLLSITSRWRICNEDWE